MPIDHPGSVFGESAITSPGSRMSKVPKFDRVKDLHKSVDMATMLDRAARDKTDNLDNLEIKLRRDGFVPFVGRFSAAEYSSVKDETKEKLCGYVDRLDKGAVRIDKYGPRSEHGSIYRHRVDHKLSEHLHTQAHQLESCDNLRAAKGKEDVSFDQSPDRNIKFSYKTPVSEL